MRILAFLAILATTTFARAELVLLEYQGGPIEISVLFDEENTVHWSKIVPDYDIVTFSSSFFSEEDTPSPSDFMLLARNEETDWTVRIDTDLGFCEYWPGDYNVAYIDDDTGLRCSGLTSVTLVPEPSSLAGAFLAIPLGFVLRRRRRVRS